MHLLFATPEIAPFSNEDAIGTSVARLSAGLRTYRPASHVKNKKEAGESPVESVAVVTPLHRGMDPDELRLARRLDPITFDWNGKTETVALWEGTTPERVRVFFLQHDGYFDRDGIYENAKGRAHKDNAERFGFFSRAVVEFTRKSVLPVDILHCCGWATGLVPVYLDAFGGDELADTLTVYATGDLAAAPTFTKKSFEFLNLPKALFSERALAQDGRLNTSKSGILFSDFVVLPGGFYLDEALDGEQGDWVAAALDERVDDTFGLLGGVDLDAWDPSKDEHLSVHFDADHLNGKRRNKAEVQHIFGLPPRPLWPLLTFLGPLTPAEGADVLADALETVLEDGAKLQIVIVADGDADNKQRFVDLQKKYPASIGLHYGAETALEHRVLASADMLVAPAREAAWNVRPAQAMRYGTVSIVTATGTLGDLVEDWDGTSEREGDATPGFVIDNPTKKELAAAITRAAAAYGDTRGWRPYVEACIRGTDLDWARSAHEHVQMYLELIEG
jgi:starch synthase